MKTTCWWLYELTATLANQSFNMLIPWYREYVASAAQCFARATVLGGNAGCRKSKKEELVTKCGSFPASTNRATSTVDAGAMPRVGLAPFHTSILFSNGSALRKVS